jgi:hypothetical protein
MSVTVLVLAGQHQKQTDMSCASYRPLLDQLNFIAVEEAEYENKVKSALQLVENRTHKLRIEQDVFSQVGFTDK